MTPRSSLCALSGLPKQPAPTFWASSPDEFAHLVQLEVEEVANQFTLVGAQAQLAASLLIAIERKTGVAIEVLLPEVRGSLQDPPSGASDGL